MLISSKETKKKILEVRDQFDQVYGYLAIPDDATKENLERAQQEFENSLYKHADDMAEFDVMELATDALTECGIDVYNPQADIVWEI